MEITTIQIRQNVKRCLERLKEKSNESYEDVIVRLIEEREKDKRSEEQAMIDGYKEMAEENLKMTREFETIEDFSDWEW